MIKKSLGCLMNKEINIFNNEIEMGLRILVILKRIYPNSLDKEMINYYSYFCLHSKDIGDSDSLHPDVPNRFGELSVKMKIIHRSIKILILKGLVKQVYIKSGVEYKATEDTTPFLDNLTENYFKELTQKAEWVCHKIGRLSTKEIKYYVNENKYKWGSELSYCTRGLLDE